METSQTNNSAVHAFTRVLEIALQREMQFRANIARLNGYDGFTSFYSDFTIGELCDGEEGVRDTYGRAFKSWRDNYKYLTELVLVLNHKIWEHYNKGDDHMARVYNDLWQDARTWAESHLKGSEMAYYFSCTD